MKIVDLEIEKTRFELVKPGEVFYFNGQYLLKILIFESKNAVNLQNGTITRVYDDDEVTLFPDATTKIGQSLVRL